jgi:hypothetical protein
MNINSCLTRGESVAEEAMGVPESYLPKINSVSSSTAKVVSSRATSINMVWLLREAFKNAMWVSFTRSWWRGKELNSMMPVWVWIDQSFLLGLMTKKTGCVLKIHKDEFQ